MVCTPGSRVPSRVASTHPPGVHTVVGVNRFASRNLPSHFKPCLLAHTAHPVASTSLNFPCPSRHGGLGLTCDILVACRALVRLALPIFREASRRGHGHVQPTTTNLVLSAGSEREHRWPSTREHMQLGRRSPIPPTPTPIPSQPQPGQHETQSGIHS